MIIILPNQICKCGSKEITQGCQHHDSHGEFHSKQWWLEHPDEVKPNIQKAVWVADPTSYKCKCGYSFSFEECEHIAELQKTLFKGPLIVENTVGVCIINPKALNNIMISEGSFK